MPKEPGEQSDPRDEQGIEFTIEDYNSAELERILADFTKLNTSPDIRSPMTGILIEKQIEEIKRELEKRKERGEKWEKFE